MIVNRDGRFKAFIVDRSVADTGDNKLCTLQATYKIVHELDKDGQWYDVSEESMEITGYHYLEKKDGSINTNTIDKIKDALGWDGLDLDWLDKTADLSEVLVQITVEHEVWQGKNRPKVKWLDHADAEGGTLKRATDTERRAMSNRLASKLRANAGGVAVPTKPPTGKPTPVKPSAPAAAPAATATAVAPTPPARRPRPTAPATVPAEPPLNLDTTFDKFCTYFSDNVDSQIVEREWVRLMGELFPGKAQEELTPAELAKFVAESKTQITPF